MAVSHLSVSGLDASKLTLDSLADIADNTSVATQDYKKAFGSAVKEISTLLDKRDVLRKEIEVIEDRIDTVRQGAISLAPLAGIDYDEMKEKYPEVFYGQLDPRIATVGITEAVREALRSADVLLTPTEIRDRVFDISPAIAGHKNPLASIHSILRRLMDSADVAVGLDTEERTVYGWIGSDDWRERIKRWFPKTEDEMLERVALLKKRRGKGID